MNHFKVKDILDKIILGYLCQIIASSTFYQYIPDPSSVWLVYTGRTLTVYTGYTDGTLGIH